MELRRRGGRARERAAALQPVRQPIDLELQGPQIALMTELVLLEREPGGGEVALLLGDLGLPAQHLEFEPRVPHPREQLPGLHRRALLREDLGDLAALDDVEEDRVLGRDGAGDRRVVVERRRAHLLDRHPLRRHRERALQAVARVAVAARAHAQEKDDDPDGAAGREASRPHAAIHRREGWGGVAPVGVVVEAACGRELGEYGHRDAHRCNSTLIHHRRCDAVKSV